MSDTQISQFAFCAVLAATPLMIALIVFFSAVK